MAVGHIFYPLIESNPGLNFQICPKDYIETLPSNFHAPLLDQSWRDSFSDLISTAQESSRNPGNGSSPACIYSCFATAGYSGRKTQDITVWDSVHVRRPIIKGYAANRLDDNACSWSYTILVFLTFFTTERKGRHFNWLQKLLILIEYRQLPASRWRWKTVTDIAIKGTKDPMFTTNFSEDTTSVKIQITVLKVVQCFTQCVSAAVFCGNIIQREMQNAHEWSILSQEPFGAIGQWGNIAIVLLVLLAAGISRFWACLDDKDTKSNYRRSNENEHMETEKEDWDWRIGYAS